MDHATDVWAEVGGDARARRAQAQIHVLGVQVDRRVEGPQRELVVAPRGPAGPHEAAAGDARGGVAGGKLDEVADLREVRRVGVGDEVDPALAAGQARLC